MSDGTGLSGARMFPDGRYECLGCGDKPHQAGRCPERTLFTKKLCECTLGIGDTVWVARS